MSQEIIDNTNYADYNHGKLFRIRSRTMWSDYISDLSWSSCLGVEEAELQYHRLLLTMRHFESA